MKEIHIVGCRNDDNAITVADGENGDNNDVF